jgi:membrane-bound lytic murein transglycosylase D
MSASAAADIDDRDGESYINAVAKNANGDVIAFQPNASDLVIQEAEQHFQEGKDAYRVKDVDTARREFDTAIDLMMRASDTPSNRELYERKFEEMKDAIHRFDLAGLGAGATAGDEPQFEKAPLEDILQLTFPVDPKQKTKVIEEFHAIASTSELPLTVNDAVMGYINYFSGRGHRTMVMGLERAGKYRPMIERILKEEGVPQELIHLAQAESGFLPRAVSRAAATGMWQFLKWRGNEYGLKQNPYTDDRLDPEKATRAAARHLHDLYNEFGNWYLAIAAYNCGPGNIEKAVSRTGYADFFDLRNKRAIPIETTNYVPIILAMTIMTKNPGEYGLSDVMPEPPVEYDTVEMTSPTHLALVGDMTDTPISQLIELNPALLRNVAPANYSLRVPKGTGEGLTAALQSVPEDRRASWRMHRVESGETLASIARRYGSAASSIASANNLISDQPATGDRLLIPTSYHEDASLAKRMRLPAASRTHSKSGRVRASSARAAAPKRSSARPTRTVARNTAFPHASGIALLATGTKSIAR